jgi:hypothetical protein
MRLQVVEGQQGSVVPGVSGGTPLAWYKVVGIELGLFATIFAALFCGILLVH